MGSWDVVILGMEPDQDGYSRHLACTYDVPIGNGLTDYGCTLAWGNDGWQVILAVKGSQLNRRYVDKAGLL